MRKQEHFPETLNTQIVLMFRCTAVIGSLYSESVWGRAVFIKPPVSETKPVLGEPLMWELGLAGAKQSQYFIVQYFPRHVSGREHQSSRWLSFTRRVIYDKHCSGCDPCLYVRVRMARTRGLGLATRATDHMEPQQSPPVTMISYNMEVSRKKVKVFSIPWINLYHYGLCIHCIRITFLRENPELNKQKHVIIDLKTDPKVIQETSVCCTFHWRRNLKYSEYYQSENLLPSK